MRRAAPGILAGILIGLLLIGIFEGLSWIISEKCERRADALELEGRHRIPGGCFVVVDGREIPLENVVVEVER